MTDRGATFKEFIGTDASVYYNSNLLTEIAAPQATVAPVTPGVWDGPLKITPSVSAFGNAPGEVVRFYTSEFEYIDMTVTDNTAGVLTVTPESEFPSASAVITTAQGLWRTYTTLTGLGHLNGKKVSVRLDGFTHASPLS